jgi:CHASE3 domain sensor protein
MVPLQTILTPEFVMILLLFLVVSVPVFIGVVVLLNRASTDASQEEIEQLRDRVEALESDTERE